jgi:hypothetical protein
VSDKNFKVKSGLQVPSLTTAGPVTTDASGNVTSSATLPISQGGTGQTTAGNALNALLPLQTGQDNKFFQTNGVSTQWTTPQQHTATDGVLGSKIYSGTVTPSSPATGDLWIDQTTGNGIQLVRWRDTIPSTTTTLTGLDDNNLVLSYTPGNEQVYINGVLITRGQDYTATNGTSVVLTQAAEAGDTVEIFGNPLFSVTDAYTQSQSNSLYVAKSGFDAAGKNKIINGDFSIWQRGTSFTASSGYTADRFTFDKGGPWTTTPTVSRQTFTPGSAPVAGYESQYFYRWSASTAGSGQTYNSILYQKIEDVRTFAGQTITVSAWVKTDAPRNFAFQLLREYGSGGSSLEVITTGPTLTTTTSWVRYSQTFNVASLNGKTVGDNSSIWIILTAQNLNIVQTYDVWGLQAELGSVATSFSTSTGSKQGELAACQRYFERVGQNAYAPYGTGLCGSTTTARINIPIQPKRSGPSAVYGTASTFEVWNSAFAGVAVATIFGVAGHKSQVNVGVTVASGLVAGNSTILIDGGTGNSYIDFSAEL